MDTTWLLVAELRCLASQLGCQAILSKELVNHLHNLETD